MAINFPASLDNGTSLPSPNTTDNTNNPSHAGLHGLENAAIIALETKLGTGSSTPASNTLLLGTGAGTSSWTALTSSQLASVLSDETGTGSAVFANTPTLVTPKVDTINENTLNNGVTVAGMNVKSGVIQTSNSVVTAVIAANAVLSGKLGLSSGFTGGVASQANAGSAGGTMYSINLGGIKLVWGTTGTLSLAAASNAAYGINFPTSFFSTIQTCIITNSGGQAATSQFTAISSNTTATTTSVVFYLISTSGSAITASTSASFLVIGT